MQGGKARGGVGDGSHLDRFVLISISHVDAIEYTHICVICVFRIVSIIVAIFRSIASTDI